MACRLTGIASRCRDRFIYKTGVAFPPVLCYFSLMKICQYQTNTPVMSSFYAPFGFYLYEKQGCYHRMAVSKNMV